jgi:prevent-host-death family protein
MTPSMTPQQRAAATSTRRVANSPKPAARKQPTGITTVDARNNFSDVINRAAYGKEHIVLTRRGKPLVAIIPAEDLARMKDIPDDGRHELDL